MKMTKKPVYNYDLVQCNKLFKLGIPPIGIGTNNKTGNTYVVFRANTRYFETLKLIECANSENNHITSNDKILSYTL